MTQTTAAMPAPAHTAPVAVGATGLDEVADEDGEDDGDLEALAEGDEECCCTCPEC